MISHIKHDADLMAILDRATEDHHSMELLDDIFALLKNYDEEGQ